jgi:hypothetical protein
MQFPRSFIAYSDLSGLLSSSDGKMDEEIKEMWIDGLKEIQCKNEDKISFEEFQAFLKGQKPFFARRRSQRISDSSLGSQSSIIIPGEST